MMQHMHCVSQDERQCVTDKGDRLDLRYRLWRRVNGLGGDQWFVEIVCRTRAGNVVRPWEGQVSPSLESSPARIRRLYNAIVRAGNPVLPVHLVDIVRDFMVRRPGAARRRAGQAEPRPSPS